MHNITDKVSFELTMEEWESCKKFFNYECAYCGMTQEEHYIKFGTDLHRDHFENWGRNDLSNCIPSCLACNSSKKRHDFYEWYKERDNGGFDQDRIKRIEDWLHDEYIKYIVVNDNGIRKKPKKITMKNIIDQEARKKKFYKMICEINDNKYKRKKIR